MTGRPSVAGEVPVIICDPRTGESYINPRRLNYRQFWVESDDVTLAADGEQTVPLTAIRGAGLLSGDVELYALAAKATGKFAVSFNLQGISRRLMNRPVEASLVLGHGAFPAQLHETIFIRAGDPIEVTVLDLSGSKNDIKLVGEGQQFLSALTPEEEHQVKTKPSKHQFWLTHKDSSEVTIPAGLSADVAFLIPSDAHFHAYDFRWRASGACSIEIREGDKSMMSTHDYMDARLIAGTLELGTTGNPGFSGGLLPAASTVRPMPRGHLFQPRTEVTVRVRNDDPNHALKFSGAFYGQKLFYRVAPNGLDDLVLARLLGGGR